MLCVLSDLLKRCLSGFYLRLKLKFWVKKLLSGKEFTFVSSFVFVVSFNESKLIIQSQYAVSTTIHSVLADSFRYLLLANVELKFGMTEPEEFHFKGLSESVSPLTLDDNSYYKAENQPNDGSSFQDLFKVFRCVLRK